MAGAGARSFRTVPASQGCQKLLFKAVFIEQKKKRKQQLTEAHVLLTGVGRGIKAHVAGAAVRRYSGEPKRSYFCKKGIMHKSHPITGNWNKKRTTGKRERGSQSVQILFVTTLGITRTAVDKRGISNTCSDRCQSEKAVLAKWEHQRTERSAN